MLKLFSVNVTLCPPWVNVKKSSTGSAGVFRVSVATLKLVKLVIVPQPPAAADGQMVAKNAVKAPCAVLASPSVPGVPKTYGFPLARKPSPVAL